MDTKKREAIEHIRPLIEERGYDAVSVGAMAAAAGVSKATFYRVFPSKEAVREALRESGVAPERLDRRDGREALLDAAMDVFAAQGYAAATVDAIAQAAGMSKAGFYWHFESKEAIFAAVIERYAPFAAIERIITEGERAGDDPHTILTRLLTEVVAAVTPRFTLFRTILIEVFQNTGMGPLFANNILGFVLPVIGGYLLRQMAAGTIQRIDPVLALQLLIGPLFFHMLTRDAFTGQVAVLPPMDVVVTRIVATFMDGVAVRTPCREQSEN